MKKETGDSYGFSVFQLVSFVSCLSFYINFRQFLLNLANIWEIALSEKMLENELYTAESRYQIHTHLPHVLFVVKGQAIFVARPQP